MNSFEALGISVTAGILVILFTWTSKILWIFAVENLWLKLTCRHLPDISGPWNAEDISTKTHKCTEILNLKQYGHKIVGESIFTIEDIATHAKEERRFAISGILRNDLLSCYYHNKNRRQKGSGTFTVALVNSGSQMLGHGTFYDTDNSKIIPVEYKLKYKQESSSN